MVRKLASAIVIAGALNAAQVNALGLGELTLHSALNEPLEAEIKLLNIGDLAENQIIVKLASHEDFENAGVERTFFLTNLQFEVDVKPDGSGIIKINTRKLVREPYLDFVIETRWPAGRLLREYTALLDLPVYKQESETTVNLGRDESYTPPSAAPAGSAPAAAAPTSQVTGQSTMSSAMPSRAAQPAYDGDTYRIQNNDTLWDVANRVKPGDDVSVQQTMVAIQQLNPHAFINNNINLLRAGSVIRVPDQDQISGISAREAIQEVAMQNREWRDGIAGAPLDARASGGGGAMAAGADGGRLSLTSAATSGAADVDGMGSADAEALRNQLAVTQDQLQVSERDKEELQSEVEQMREQLETLQRMVELKDQKLAEVQAQMGAQGETDETSAEMESFAATGEMDSGEMESGEMESGETTSTMDADEAMEAETAALDEQETVAEEEAAAAAKAAAEQAAKPKPASRPAPKPEPGFMEQFLANPLYWGGALLLVIAGIVAVVLKRRGAAEEEEYSYTEETSEADFDEAEEGFEEVEEDAAELEDEVAEEEALEEEEAEEAPAAAQSETGDAIGEADIYVAYGRYQHAIELLKNAIGGEPERMDLRLKLLEVYLEAGDKEGFKDQFAVLQTMGDQAALAKAKELLSTVDGASDWLSGEAVADERESLKDVLGEPEAEPEIEEEPVEDKSIDYERVDLADAGEAEIEDVELDLDDLGAEDEVTLEFDSIDDGNDLDLSESLNEDLGLDEESEELDSSFALDTVEEEPADIELDLDTEFGEDLADEEPDFSIEEGLASGSDAVIEESIDEAFEESLEQAGDDLGAGDDLADLDTDLSFEEEAAPAAQAPAATPAASSEDDLEFLTDADEVATKLDLARAYIEMGDVDGARDILEEVINEGEDAQKAEANRLMERIG